MIHNADVNTLEHLAAVKSARAQKDAADHAALAEAPRRKLPALPGSPAPYDARQSPSR